MSSIKNSARFGCLAACAGAAITAAAAPPTCDVHSVHSGAITVALVELYSSEGCSSCPPADKQLARLPAVLDAGAEAIPLALHVGYWDYIGWKDPFSRSAFAERQSWLVGLNQHRTVYTPHFFVSGTEQRGGEVDLRGAVRRVNALPPRADIQLQATLEGPALAVQAQATTRQPAPDAALYLALTESGLVSQVVRGENSGATLAHDHVVREWLGPVPMGAAGARLQPRITLPAGWKRDRLGLVAFVQDQRSGQVLQALSVPLSAMAAAGACPRPGPVPGA